MSGISFNVGLIFYYWSFYENNNDEDLYYNYKGSKYSDFYVKEKWKDLKQSTQTQLTFPFKLITVSMLSYSENLTAILFSPFMNVLTKKGNDWSRKKKFSIC